MIVAKILTSSFILLHKSAWTANLITQDKPEAEHVVIMVIYWFHGMIFHSILMKIVATHVHLCIEDEENAWVEREFQLQIVTFIVLAVAGWG